MGRNILEGMKHENQSRFPAKCKNVDRLVNFPTAPMFGKFGCKQPFLARDPSVATV